MDSPAAWTRSLKANATRPAPSRTSINLAAAPTSRGFPAILSIIWFSRCSVIRFVTQTQSFEYWRGCPAIRLSPNQNFADGAKESYEEINKETSRGQPGVRCRNALVHSEATREEIQRLSPVCGLLGRGKAGAGFSDRACCSIRSSGVRSGPPFLSDSKPSVIGMVPPPRQPS